MSSSSCGFFAALLRGARVSSARSPDPFACSPSPVDRAERLRRRRAERDCPPPGPVLVELGSRSGCSSAESSGLATAASCLGLRDPEESRLCGGRLLRPRFGGGVVGSTLARTLASPLSLPKSPGRGSVMVTNSASDSSTPSMSSAASRAVLKGLSGGLDPLHRSTSLSWPLVLGAWWRRLRFAVLAFVGSRITCGAPVGGQIPNRPVGFEARPLLAAGGFACPLADPFVLEVEGLEPVGLEFDGSVPAGLPASRVIASIDPPSSAWRRRCSWAAA